MRQSRRTYSDDTPLLGGRVGSTGYLRLIILVLSLIAVGLLAWAITTTVLYATRNPTKRCGTVDIPESDECFDVVVIGGGTAALTMGYRITANSNLSVLMLEAGPSKLTDPVIRNPDKAFSLLSDYFLQYFWWGETIIQTQLNNRIFRFSNGRVVGGGATVNGMQVVRGTNEFWDYADAASGFHGVWDALSMYERYKSLDDFDNHGQFPLGSTRASGTLPGQRWKTTTRPVNVTPDIDYVANVFSTSYGIPIVDDYNEFGQNNVVFKQWQVQQNTSTAPFYDRTDAQTCFAGPDVLNQTTYTSLNQQKLTLRTKSTVVRMYWDPLDNTHCIGVEYTDADLGEFRRVYAAKTVVLSANIHDPQILQLEGIGPAATLAAAGVEPRVINEHVGRHWMNHALYPNFILCPSCTGDSPDPGTRGSAVAGKGGVFVRDPSIYGSDSQRGFQLILFEAPGILAVYPLHNRPFSSGTIDIQTNDPLALPIVDNGYLTDARDLASWRAFLRRLAMLNQTDPSLVLLIDPSVLANDAALNFYIETNIIQNVHHWSSGVRMATNGWDPVTGGVVDYRTRVFNTTGLRVCDCMILPEVADGNLATPAVAIGATCADMILEDFAPTTKKRTTSSKHGKRTNMFTPETYLATAQKYADKTHVNTTKKKRELLTTDDWNKYFNAPVIDAKSGPFYIPDSILAQGLAAYNAAHPNAKKSAKAA